jgi:outer membrane protein OmpA-like peptidoglycan-associated protein
VVEEPVPPPPPPPPPAEKKQAKSSINIGAVYYRFDSSDLSSDAINELNNVIIVLNEKTDAEIEVEGYCDSRGSSAYNITLSKRRAKSAYNYLVQHGIASDRIIEKGLGESNLVNHCADGVQCTEAQHALNRRVEFKIID